MFTYNEHKRDALYMALDLIKSDSVEAKTVRSVLKLADQFYNYMMSVEVDKIIPPTAPVKEVANEVAETTEHVPPADSRQLPTG